MLLYQDPSEIFFSKGAYIQGLTLPFTIEIEVKTPKDEWVTHPIISVSPKHDNAPSWSLSLQRKSASTDDGVSSSIYASGYQGSTSNASVQARLQLPSEKWVKYVVSFGPDRMYLYIDGDLKAARKHNLYNTPLSDRVSYGWHQYDRGVHRSKYVRFRNMKLWEGMVYPDEMEDPPEPLELPVHQPRTHHVTVQDWSELRQALADARQTPGYEITLLPGEYEADGNGFGVPAHTTIRGSGADTLLTKTITLGQNDCILEDVRLEIPSSVRRWGLMVDGSYGQGKDITIRNVSSHRTGPRNGFESFEITHGASRVLVEHCRFGGAGQNVFLVGSDHMALRRCIIEDGGGRMPRISEASAVLVECAIDLYQPMYESQQSSASVGSKDGGPSRAGFIRCSFENVPTGQPFGPSTGLPRGGVYVEDMLVNRVRSNMYPPDLLPELVLARSPYTIPVQWEDDSLSVEDVWTYCEEHSGAK